MFLSKGRFGVNIVPLGNIRIENLEMVRQFVQKKFRKKAFYEESIKMPLNLINKERDQYSVLKVIDFLKGRKKFKEKIIGVTDKDIYIDERPFTFAYSDTISGTIIISTWRLEQGFKYFDMDEKLFKKRLKKIVLREFTRTLDVPYCCDPKCVMFEPFTIDELDFKRELYCKDCQSYL